MKSFVNAFRGIGYALLTERNIRIHFAAVFYAVITGIILEIELHEWGLIALVCGLVIGAELLNTALERLCDGPEPEHSPVIKCVKDLAAGAVFICALAAVGVAALILLEPIHFYLVCYGPELLPEEPAFWVGVIALPLWVLFIVFGGRKKKQ